MIKTICNILAAVALISMIGLAGASDTNNIRDETLYMHGAVSAVVLVGSRAVAQRKGA